MKHIKELNEADKSGEYGGKGKFELPKNHVAGMRVPKGGSSCASCKFLMDKNHCSNTYWIEWNGGDTKLPYPADEYCSDFYEPQKV